MTCPVYVLLRLDTEDFIHPESNDAVLELARLLTNKGITATFTLVAEKVTFLQQTGRHDVFQSLRHHHLGYHSATHSRHPTIAESLEGVGWQAGQDLFDQRERSGLELVREAVDRPICCYTQPGGNWVPHAYPILEQWGIPLHYSEGWNCYLDWGDQPYYLLGTASWSAPVTAPKPLLNQLPAVLPQAVRLVKEAHQRLQQQGGGLINIVTHPTELVTTSYWDVANFGGGLNHCPTRRVRLRPASLAQAAIQAFSSFLDTVAKLPGVEFIGAGQLLQLLACGSQAEIPVEMVVKLARRIGEQGEVGYQRLDSAAGVSWLSAADLFVLLLQGLVGDWGSAGKVPCPPVWQGPGEEPPPALTGHLFLPRSDLVDACRRILTRENLCQQMPAAVEVGTVSLRPEEFMGAAARAYLDTEEQLVVAKPVKLAPMRHVKQPDQLHWNWPVFAPGFTAPGILAATRRQVWTLKPAEVRL